MICERCWAEAFGRSVDRPDKSQYHHYLELLEENDCMGEHRLTPREEYEARCAREREKALRKYGEEGLLPGGNPELDVLDYATNEVVGLRRYAEIIFNRRSEWPPEFSYRTAALARKIEEFSQMMGIELIALRQGLVGRGVDMGRAENDGQ